MLPAVSASVFTAYYNSSPQRGLSMIDNRNMGSSNSSWGSISSSRSAEVQQSEGAAAAAAAATTAATAVVVQQCNRVSSSISSRNHAFFLPRFFASVYVDIVSINAVDAQISVVNSGLWHTSCTSMSRIRSEATSSRLQRSLILNL